MLNNRTHSYLKPPLLQKHIHKYTPISEIKFKTKLGYKRIFQCECLKDDDYGESRKCNAKFRTKELMIKHITLKHPRLKKPERWFSTVLIDGEYIKGRMCECKTKVMIFENDLDMKREIQNSCFIRICPKCYRTRKGRYIRHYKRLLKYFKRVSLLTLTHKGYHDLDIDKKKEFEYAVKKFFQMIKYRYKHYNFKKIRILETKRKKDGKYYYHFHFLIDMPWIPQTMLSAIWSKATAGESYVVDIRWVGKRWSDKQKLGYICKYLAKPFSNITPNEYALHLYRTRFVDCRFDVSSVSSLVSYSIMEEKQAEYEQFGMSMEYRYIETVDLRGGIG